MTTSKTKIEMEDYSSRKSRLYELHQHQMLNAKTNQHDMPKLVEILGGIDQILSDYLKGEQTMLLTDQQLQAIGKVINSDSKEIHVVDIQPKSTTQSIEYTFNKSNTFMHHIFGITRANKLCKIIYNKILWAALGTLLGICYTMGSFVESFTLYQYIQLFGALILTINAILLSFVFLSVNRKVFKSSIKHFVFWFKICSAMEVVISGFVINYVFDRDPTILTFISVFNHFLIDLCMMLLIVIFSSLDGYFDKINTSKWNQGIINLFMETNNTDCDEKK